MDSIKEITEEDIEELFDGRIFSRGEEYFQEGLVDSVEMIDNNTIMGIVLGNDRYEVTISLDSEEDIICDCTCPYDFNCKHAVALLLQWISVKKNFNKNKTYLKDQSVNKTEEEPIEEIILKKSKDELASLVLEMLNRNPELKSLIVLRKNEIIQKTRMLFLRFWEWNEIRELISELELVLQGIRKSRQLWNKDLLDEMEKASNIIIKGIDSVHDEGELGIFLEEWYETYGEIFSSVKPSKKEKIEFVKKILGLIDKDEYSMEGSYEKAFLGMCENLEDVELIKEYYKLEETEEDYDDESYYDNFYLDLYEKIGDNENFLKFSKEKGFSIERIKKLIELERFKDALQESEKQKEFSEEIENLRIQILRKFDKLEEVKNSLFKLANKMGEISYVKKLKKECDKKEWKEYLKKIISNAKKKNWKEFVSRIYFSEEDYKNAYEYGKDLSCDDYLELLAKKLSNECPGLACKILRKLCFEHIGYGSGWPYKKAGQLLKQIKKTDDSGSFFKKTKNEIILKHKKKYSLMNIIERV